MIFKIVESDVFITQTGRHLSKSFHLTGIFRKTCGILLLQLRTGCIHTPIIHRHEVIVVTVRKGILSAHSEPATPNGQLILRLACHKAVAHVVERMHQAVVMFRTVLRCLLVIGGAIGIEVHICGKFASAQLAGIIGVHLMLRIGISMSGYEVFQTVVIHAIGLDITVDTPCCLVLHHIEELIAQSKRMILRQLIVESCSGIQTPLLILSITGKRQCP
ncbi:hypothetical protein IMSAGC014_01056 [Bacteroidaceae bacterium]|nr:hypothetical protein IMSAGC014_01056 [Bacteroidaceae bacterium]